MVSTMELWPAILLASAAVFVVSTLVHMVLPLHRGDYTALPDEDGILEAMRRAGVRPGSYMFPRPPDMKAMKSPEMQEKYARGPVGFMTIVAPGPPRMGRGLALWFLYGLIVAFFMAYVGTMALGRGAVFGDVFRVTGTVGILGYGASYFVDSVWKGQRWAVTLRFVFDGVLYALAAAAVFGWFWPAA